MNPIVFALRRTATVMVLAVAVALGSCLAVTRMSVDIFPNLNLPVVSDAALEDVRAKVATADVGLT
jgi:multidrug efflux pump subunit AcrB